MTPTLCPEHGPGVEIDEDGCCVTCGATAIGSWVEKRAKMRPIRGWAIRYYLHGSVFVVLVPAKTRDTAVQIMSKLGYLVTRPKEVCRSACVPVSFVDGLEEWEP